MHGSSSYLNNDDSGNTEDPEQDSLLPINARTRRKQKFKLAYNIVRVSCLTFIMLVSIVRWFISASMPITIVLVFG